MRIVPTDDGYLLENALGESIKLTMTEALELAPIAHQLQNHIRSQRRLFPILSISVEDVILSLDAHHSQVILRLVQQGGLETSYVLSLESSKRTRDGLTIKIDQIEAAQQTRSKQ